MKTPPATLATLIADYEKSVIFAEGIPNAYRMARMFCDMQWSNGGLVLLGVRADGVILGINPDELDGIYARFQALCSKLTPVRVEIGTIEVNGRIVVFLVFNTISPNMAPLLRYRTSIRRVAVF